MHSIARGIQKSLAIHLSYNKKVSNLTKDSFNILKVENMELDILKDNLSKTALLQTFYMFQAKIAIVLIISFLSCLEKPFKLYHDFIHS